MALFDTKTTGTLDDTATLTATIEAAENIHGYTEYVVRVTRGFGQKDLGWTVRRRFRDFVALNGKLIENVPQLQLPLPPKKVFGNLNREFVARRTQDLQVYLNTILSFPFVALSIHVREFLDPRNYSQKFSELALQNVSVCMRGSQAVVVQKALPNIGWRIRKTYILAKSLDGAKDERRLVAWAFYGPDYCLDYPDAQLVLDFLCKVKHSQIRSPETAVCTEKGVVLIKGPLEPNGTIRDVLCNAKPERSFLQKYACPREPNCFDIRQLQLLGRKILEGLKFLKEKHIPFKHLHCGNLIVTRDDHVQFLDIENDILGLAPMHRAFMVQCKAVKTFEDVVVYSFGHTLYEIIFGITLNQPFIAQGAMPVDCPQPFVSVLHELLSQEAAQNGLPSLDDLLSRDVFISTWYQTISTRDDVDFKVPSKVKQLLSRCTDAFMERLQRDQTEYRRAVKMKKTEDYMNSEEQKRLRKRALRAASKETASLFASAAPSQETRPPPISEPKNDDAVAAASAHQQNATGATSVAAANIDSKTTEQQSSCSTASSQEAACSVVAAEGDRSALLASIRNFSTTRLKKAVTIDKSAPKF